MLALTSVVAGAALALSACSNSSDDDAAAGGSTASGPADYGDLAVQLSWIKNSEFLGEYMADTNGYYKDAGFSKVNLVAGPSTGVAELVSKKADVALSDAVSVGTAVANEDAPVKIIGTTYQKNPFTVLSLKDGANISTPQDLVGKKIGVQDSNLSLFQALLAANGIDKSKVTVVPVQYDPSVLTNGEVDGYIAYLTNESIIVENEGHAVTNLPFADNGLPFVAETFTVTDDSIKNDRAELEAFLTAEIKGWKDALKDPAGAIAVDQKSYGQDLKLDAKTEAQSADAQAKLIESDDTTTNGLFTISDELQQETLKSLEGAGLKLEASDLFDMSLLDDVYKAHPELKG
ncbi:ABC transporter substrate-binding protein [Luteimicrobium subarcticum]|uniref:ABC transporter substrate-binding protein n=1 Tax=Luteimicrobium subarcticum TaxID=620910 RepID=UPI000C240577|nr:ABC transporter substrate-binding protein [Luteimicrobium subarcticum]